jgi:hypothetical protein
MAGEGRVTGRVSRNGKNYELVQFGKVRVRIALSKISDKMRARIVKQGWEQPQ